MTEYSQSGAALAAVPSPSPSPPPVAVRAAPRANPARPAVGAAARVTGGKNYTIAMITHEQAGDTFWDKIRAGAKDAAATHGIDLKYSNNENGPENATLVQNAIDSKVDGIALTLSNAAQVIPVAQKAVAAGIPVVVFNQGFDDYTKAGSKMYFGSDELLAGQTIGKKITEERRRQGAVHHPGPGLGRAGDPLRGREGGLREHGEPAGQRRRPAVGAVHDRGEAAAGQVHHPHRDARARRSRCRRSRPRVTRAARPR